MGVKEVPATYQVPADVSRQEEVDGFQYTEAGVIPRDWKALPLNEVAQIRSGGTPSTINPACWDGDIPWCTPTDITALGGRKYLWSTQRSISDVGLRSSSAELIPASSVIMTSRATIGACAINLIPVTTNQGFKNLVPLGETSADFLYYLMCTKVEDLIRLSAGSTFLEIGKSELARFSLQMPPLREEQRAIAELLSDADALIESMQELIAKKYALKQGAMQMLLTGRQRLPGFNQDWDVRRLGDFGGVYGGLSGKTKRDFGHGRGRFVTFMGVMSGVVVNMAKVEPVDVLASESQNAVLKGDLLFNGSSETPQEIGLCAVVNEQIDGVYLNSFCFGYRMQPGAPLDPLFLAYFYRSKVGRELLAPLAQGAIRYNLSKRALLELEFELPPKEEQTAIATVLSDMDAEIDVLETRLAKTRELKAGMMQALLTGRIRLPLGQVA